MNTNTFQNRLLSAPQSRKLASLLQELPRAVRLFKTLALKIIPVANQANKILLIAAQAGEIHHLPSSESCHFSCRPARGRRMQRSRDPRTLQIRFTWGNSYQKRVKYHFWRGWTRDDNDDQPGRLYNYGRSALNLPWSPRPETRSATLPSKNGYQILVEFMVVAIPGMN